MTQEKKNQQFRRKTENTVFVKFVPGKDITRFHLEEHFGSIGPIKKCSVILNDSSKKLGYGFVKYVTQADAEQAMKSFSGKRWNVNGQSYKLTVELASNEKGKKEKSEKVPQQQRVAQEETPQEEADLEKEKKRRKTNRVIVRNLSFYATEFHVQKILEQEFGPIVDVHIPRVGDTKTHRGFCFVTFESTRDAVRAVQPRGDNPILIKKRPVAIDYSTPKSVHQQTMKQQQQEQQDEETSSTSDDSSDDSSDGEEEQEQEKDRNDDDDDSSSKEEEDDDDSSDSSSVKDNAEKEGEAAVSKSDRDDDDQDDAKEETIQPVDKEGCTLFLRNLPFDATRHDVFTLFRKFGRIKSVYLVKDKETGVAKGTAFLTFEEPYQAQRVLEQGSSTDAPFVTQRDSSTTTSNHGDFNGSLFLRGRRVLVDLAVDKQTAATMQEEKQQHHPKDKRNLYLKTEGRVANVQEGGTWELLPEGDQMKRQGAFADKNTKLQSPLFYINPFRLSIRNLAKHVTLKQLKQLCVDGIERGLKQKLVSQQDQVAHWKASGELSQRDILQRISAKEDLPAFDKMNIKQYIPSLYIDMDAASSTSRGFGFVEFTHHVHALACLRELNNNPLYSQDYVAGGKQATQESKRKKKKKTDQGEKSKQKTTLIPRLIVEFTVENKAKAKKQAQHRAQQQANVTKQKLESLEKRKQETESGASKSSRKSRGKAQRERKRKARESGADAKATPKAPPKKQQKREEEKEVDHSTPKPKALKPTKKRKIDKEEAEFESMVRSYKALAGAPDDKESRADISKKRWFD